MKVNSIVLASFALITQLPHATCQVVRGNSKSKDNSKVKVTAAPVKVTAAPVPVTAAPVKVTAAPVPVTAAPPAPSNGSNSTGGFKDANNQKKGYQVWASDQSNSAPGQTALGVKGGFLWVYDSVDIDRQLAGGVDAQPLPCSPMATVGPCNVLNIFPETLTDSNSASLKSLNGFGRLHGALPSNDGRYINVNMFAPGGGYVGIIDTETREAIGLFRVTNFNFSTGTSTTTGRSVHMSFWSSDDSALIISNLNGKAIERINVIKDSTGKIIDLVFDKSATLGLGKNMTVVDSATSFTGLNERGNQLIGTVSGNYDPDGIQDLTPNNVCKENGCVGGKTGAAGGRGNNAPICPIPSRNHNNLYITLAGGGLFVADLTTTPISIVGEYGQAVVYGAGCGGAQVKNQMFLNAGTSTAEAGATQSMFALFSFDDDAFPVGGGSTINPENSPMPIRIFQDPGNTQTGGSVEGSSGVSDNSGQKPGITTRRDSHGTVGHPNLKYVYVADRIQNVMEVFDTTTYERSTFDLVSRSGLTGRAGPSSACYSKSVLDDAKLALDDPTPDLMDITPDGSYIMASFRGPAPVSVSHSSQGSCPGVGIVELLDDGKFGRLVGVLRTTNTIADAVNITQSTFLGGVAYTGSERSDVHGVVVIPKRS